jgi:hypothetical protein
MFNSRQSVAPFGVRYAGEGAKGKGYFGIIGRPDGNFSSELSAESNINGKNAEFPLLVPTLSREEIQHLIGGGKPTDEIYRKASSYAAERMSKGMNPFAGNNELRYPLPQF